MALLGVAGRHILFGWSAGDVPGPIPRTSFTLGDLLIGGGHAPTPGEDPSPRWTVSFGVGDTDQAAAEVQRLGGTTLLPPMDVPVGRFTIVADPQGAHAPLQLRDRRLIDRPRGLVAAQAEIDHASAGGDGAAQAGAAEDQQAADVQQQEPSPAEVSGTAAAAKSGHPSSGMSAAIGWVEGSWSCR
jgi:predicted enzyme related to lactoylglutathione lyase